MVPLCAPIFIYVFNLFYKSKRFSPHFYVSLKCRSITIYSSSAVLLDFAIKDMYQHIFFKFRKGKPSSTS